MPQVVAVIPARGGSSRIPRKNIKDFNGRPIMAWPMRACQESPAAGAIVVSTDDAEIADIARELGASDVLDRPAALASATAGTAQVITHAIDHLQLSDDTVVMCVYPTATVTSAVIADVIALGALHPDKFVVTVGRHRSPLERSLEPVQDNLMALSSHNHLLTRTQDLPQRHFDAGKLYLATAAVWKSRETMMEVPFVPFHLPDWAAVDIDEPDDWAIAEALHRVFVVEAP